MIGKSITKDIVFNLIGQTAPMLVAIFAIPVLINKLGTDRFGILTLAWTVIGYFSLFDLGLGRALTKLVAEKVGTADEHEIPALVWSSITLISLVGLISSLILLGMSHWLVEDILKIPSELKYEARIVFLILSCSIPIVIISTGFRGVLEAKRQFFITNVVRLPLGVFTFLGPLLVLPLSNSLVAVIVALLGFRLIALLAYLFFCLYFIPDLRFHFALRTIAIHPLIRFGGWITISNIISPLLIYLDRFFIGTMISVKALAYYSTPLEVVTKLLVVPGAMVGVLFPVFSSSFSQDAMRTTQLYHRGLRYLFLLLFPITLAVVTFSKEGLTLWLGADFARNSIHVMQLLIIGVLLNGIASIPYAFIQGIGRPDITAKFHVIELFIYLPCTWWLINKFGIQGAAFAWMFRVGIDAFLLHNFSIHFLIKHRTNYKQYLLSAILLLAALLTGLIPLQIVAKMAIFGVITVCFALSAWFAFIIDEERFYFKKLIGAMK